MHKKNGFKIFANFSRKSSFFAKKCQKRSQETKNSLILIAFLRINQWILIKYAFGRSKNVLNVFLDLWPKRRFFCQLTSKSPRQIRENGGFQAKFSPKM